MKSRYWRHDRPIDFRHIANGEPSDFDLNSLDLDAGCRDYRKPPYPPRWVNVLSITITSILWVGFFLTLTLGCLLLLWACRVVASWIL